MKGIKLLKGISKNYKVQKKLNLVLKSFPRKNNKNI